MASQRRKDGDREAVVLDLDLRRVVGENLRLAQRTARLKNSDITAAVGIDVGLLVKHKAGKTWPGPQTLVKYARLFDRPPAWFFEEREDEWAL